MTDNRKPKTTVDVVRPILRDTYGKSAMCDALASHLAVKIDAWPICSPRYATGTREYMVAMICWDWFSGGDTAGSVAKQIEDALS